MKFCGNKKPLKSVKKPYSKCVLSHVGHVQFFVMAFLNRIILNDWVIGNAHVRSGKLLNDGLRSQYHIDQSILEKIQNISKQKSKNYWSKCPKEWNSSKRIVHGRMRWKRWMMTSKNFTIQTGRAPLAMILKFIYFRAKETICSFEKPYQHINIHGNPSWKKIHYLQGSYKNLTKNAFFARILQKSCKWCKALARILRETHF